MGGALAALFPALLGRYLSLAKYIIRPDRAGSLNSVDSVTRNNGSNCCYSDLLNVIKHMRMLSYIKR